MNKRATRCTSLMGSLLVLCVAAGPASGHDLDDILPSLGLDVGYFFPTGDWNMHRYAPAVEHFGGGVSLGAEFDMRLWGIGLGLFYSDTRLDVSQWVSYAQSQGDQISATARLVSYGFLLKYYLTKRAPSFLDIEIGLSFNDISGQETFGVYQYDYNFFDKSSGFVVGLGYKHLLGRSIALAVTARTFIIFEGLKYPDGVTSDITGVTATVGIRFVF